MSRQVIINWSISSFFGWGVYGLNLALEWASDPEIRPYCSFPIADVQVAVDPLRRRALAPLGRRSLALQKQLEGQERLVNVEAALLHSLDDRFDPTPTREGVILLGQPTIGVTFFNDTTLRPDAVARAASYPAMVAGSTWNQQVMEAYGLTNVRTIIQGVDPTLFHPAPRQGAMSDRFLVFSGGKLERRKGQDIVMAAFAKFAARRPDALLVTAWQSPWPVLARTLDVSGVAAPVVIDANDRLDVVAWAKANGVGPGHILDLGMIPNAQMPPVLREMDVAVFPNRCEGGTNLVAMEAMACGVPTILSRNTGHLDLIEGDNSYTLDAQGVLTGVEAPYKDVEGWGESDVDELVELLDRAYLDREDARRRGLAGARTLERFSWAATAAQMKSLIWELS